MKKLRYLILAMLLLPAVAWATSTYIIGIAGMVASGAIVATQVGFLNGDEYTGDGVIFGVYDSDRNLVAQTSTWSKPGDCHVSPYCYEKISLTSSLTLTPDETYYIAALVGGPVRFLIPSSGDNVMQDTDGTYSTLDDPLPEGSPQGLREHYMTLLNSSDEVVLGPTGDRANYDTIRIRSVGSTDFFWTAAGYTP